VIEHEQSDIVPPDQCAACIATLGPDEIGRPVCFQCDAQFQRELEAWLEFDRVCRGEHPRPRAKA
jgi:hypothetical protein